MALAAAQDSLKKTGLGFKILDAYRPYAGTLYFYGISDDTARVVTPVPFITEERP